MWTITSPTCPTTNDTLDVTRYFQPVADAGSGGDNCGLSFNLNATASVPAQYRVSYTAGWIKTSGPGNVINWGAGQSQPVTTITVDTYGTYEFTWTETNGLAGACTDFETITVRFIEQPNVTEGSGGTVCGPDFTFSAVKSITDEDNYTSQWSQISGPGGSVYGDAASPVSDVTVDAYGDYVYEWKETNGDGYCRDSATVNVIFVYQPVAGAGSGGQQCGPVFNLNATRSVPLADRTPEYTATWSLTSGPGGATFGTATNPATTVTVDTYGTYEFTWTESNGTVPCTDAETITVTFYEQPVADAGSGGSECDLDFIFSAVESVTNKDNYTSLWYKVSGPGNVLFDDATSQNATVTVDDWGQYVFRWVEKNGNGYCGDSGGLSDSSLYRFLGQGIRTRKCQLRNGYQSCYNRYG
jgi:NADPH-dependent 7-cyano-7-deazaguanine reductase QueF-like protein